MAGFRGEEGFVRPPIADTLAERTHLDTDVSVISVGIWNSHKSHPDRSFLCPSSPLVPSNASQIHFLRFAQFLHRRCRLRCSPVHCPHRVFLHHGARLSPTLRYPRYLGPSSQDRHDRPSPATSCRNFLGWTRSTFNPHTW